MMNMTTIKRIMMTIVGRRLTHHEFAEPDS